MIPWLDCLSIKNYLQLEKDSDRIEIADLRKNKTRLVSRRNVFVFPYYPKALWSYDLQSAFFFRVDKILS
jgi:hypothetical protein